MYIVNIITTLKNNAAMISPEGKMKLNTVKYT